ncbi:MAG: ribonuclease [Microbacteriaceae bacterium]|nr:ribonuclease [Microbacteriaceae bacterium]
MVVSHVRLTSAPTGELAAAFLALREQLQLSETFPPAVEAEAALAAANVTMPPLDSTDIPFITIDPEGSTDLDQALHLERNGDGYRAFYAIADVPAFVTPNGAVDTEARHRGQTVYAPDGRIPLHPTVLSEHAASLLPNQLRSAFVWTFELDAAASVKKVTVARAKITSRRQCSYVEVQAELDAGTASEAVQLLREIGEKRIALEKARGGASLNRPDQEVEEHDGQFTLVRRRSLPTEGWNAQLSLMTGMAAADLMLSGGVGILRSMPAPDDETILKFRRQTVALGSPWMPGIDYGEYLRSLDLDDPRQLAIVQAAGSLFRGAGYRAFDGAAPTDAGQAAVGAPYAHATAPLRRLVDRFVLLTCEALSAKTEVPAWVREALPTLPAIMAKSDTIASRLDRGSIDAVEAAILKDRVGDVFEATVVSVRKGGGVVQVADPAVTAECTGELQAGAVLQVTLASADIATGTVLFRG